MSDLKTKLDALLKKQGLKTGAQLAAEREQQPSAPVHDLPSPMTHEPPPLPVEYPGGGRLRDRHERLVRLREKLALANGTAEDEFSIDFETGETMYAGAPRALEDAVPGQVIGGEDGGFYLVRHEYPLAQRHGRVALGEVLDSDAAHFAFSAQDEALHDFDPRTACFVDTETSGIAGGAGTIAFLVGVGYFVGDVFRLDQCFLRDYDDEEAMLEYLAGIFKDCKTLVSYNGKSFDLPLLRSRFVQGRQPFRLDGVTHLDLVHVTRRVWKRRLGSCTLGNIEREVLGIEREGDVPGYLIPQLWFNWLHNGDARPLEGVFYHHEMDILSLVSLAAWLSKCLGAPEGEGFAHREDRLSIVRLHFRQKNYEAVVELGRAFLEAELASELRAECFELMGLSLKKLAHWNEMQRAWESMAAEFPQNVTAFIELAKHHEHRTRDFGAAGRYAASAVELANHAQNRQLAQHAQHRMTRIQAKGCNEASDK